MRGLFVPVYHPLSMLGRGVLHDSEYLYVVILVIKSGIYALYVDFVRFCLHLSSDDIHHPSRTPKEVIT
jgi:chemotaxis signal transduction protein